MKNNFIQGQKPFNNNVADTFLMEGTIKCYEAFYTHLVFPE